MILMRLVWQAQLGRAHEVVAAMTQAQAVYREIVGNDVHVRLLTDLSGPFDTIVQEIQMDSLAAMEQMRAKMFSDPRFHEMQANMPPVMIGGRAEFYTIESEF